MPSCQNFLLNLSYLKLLTSKKFHARHCSSISLIRVVSDKMRILCLLTLSIINKSLSYVHTHQRVLVQRREIFSGAMVLDKNSVEKLEEIKSRYDNLANVETNEAIEEKAKLEDVVKKYGTYKEIKLMMGKLRTMWKTEESERRKSRQLSSFLSLYKGKVELEEALLEKIGAPSRGPQELLGLSELQKWDEEIEALEKKLAEVEIKLPEGRSTTEARFS